MKKIALGLIIFICIFLVSFKSSWAQEPQESPIPENITSFELFWPIVAGKTIDDPLYGLKTLKEKVRGFFIFGKAEKADYHVFLATKRVVEAEKLINEGKREPTMKTLDKAIVLLKSAETEVSNSSVESMSSDTKDNVNKQLGNIEIFIPVLTSQLKSQDDSLVAKLQEVLEAAKAF